MQRVMDHTSSGFELQGAFPSKAGHEQIHLLRDEFDEHLKRVQSALDIEIQMRERADELNAQKIKALKTAIDGASAKGSCSELAGQIERLSAALAQKAEDVFVRQIAQGLHVLNEQAALQAQADAAHFSRLQYNIAVLTEKVSERITHARSEEIERQLKILSKQSLEKAERASLDDLVRQVTLLRDDVSQKAEGHTLEFLDCRLQALSSDLAQRPDRGTVEQAIAQLTDLAGQVAKKADAGQLSSARSQLQALREDLLSNRSEIHRVEDLLHLKLRDSAHFAAPRMLAPARPASEAAPAQPDLEGGAATGALPSPGSRLPPLSNARQ